MNVHEHFEDLYGEMNLSPRDAARWVFASGWNSALEELLKRDRKSTRLNSSH